MNNLLASLIRQLCGRTQILPQSVRDIWTSHNVKGSRPTRAQLIDTLDQVVIGLETINQRALIVLDGLDEYPLMAAHDSSEWQQTSAREDVLHWLEQLFTKHVNTHLLVLSRDETDIRSKLIKAIKIKVAKRVYQVLDFFIQTFIDRIVREKPWKKAYESELLSRVKDNHQSQVYLRR